MAPVECWFGIWRLNEVLGGWENEKLQIGKMFLHRITSVILSIH